MHASSGLTRHYQPKPSFHAVAHLFATLGDYRFERAVTEKPGELFVTAFRHGAKPDHSIWAAWSPTGTGRKAVTRIRVPGATLERAERMALGAKAPESVRLTHPNGGEIELEVSESPVYLWFRQ